MLETSCTEPWVVVSHVLAKAYPACSDALDVTEFGFELTPLTYLGYFALTYAIELPFVVLAVGRRRALLTALALNLATHPLICLVFVKLAQGHTFGEFTLAAEGFALSMEMLIASVMTRSLKVPAWIFVANLCSWTAGSFL